VTEYTQESIMEMVQHMQLDSDYGQTGILNPLSLKGNFPDEDVIEACINTIGTSGVAEDYGWWPRSIDRLIEAFGEDLRPVCQRRMEHPFHGGGTAYGVEYLEAAKRRSVRFCEVILARLDREVPA
jgi:hypothetical protein